MDCHDWEEMTHQQPTTAPIQDRVTIDGTGEPLTAAEIKHRGQYRPLDVHLCPVFDSPIVTETADPEVDAIICNATAGDFVDGT